MSDYLGVDNFSGPHASSKKAVYLKVYDLKSRRRYLGQCLLAEDDPKLKDEALGNYAGNPSEIAALVARMPLKQ